jgi:hypothetical protein
VFAGEDVECTITFKNVAVPNGRDKSPNPARPGSFGPSGERQRKLPPVQSSSRPSISRNSSFVSQMPPPHIRGHRPALSLTTPPNGERRSPALPSAPHAGGPSVSRHAHQRSLSIMSLGKDGPAELSHDRTASPRRPRGHGRSASLHVVPGRQSQFGGTWCHSVQKCTLIRCQWYLLVIGPPHTIRP